MDTIVINVTPPPEIVITVVEAGISAAQAAANAAAAAASAQNAADSAGEAEGFATTSSEQAGIATQAAIDAGTYVGQHEIDYDHANLPTADEKAALAGTGTPSATNKYVTEDTIGDISIKLSINPQTGTTYTLVMTDAGKLVRCSNANAITLTIPKNSVVAFPVGTFIDVEQQGAGVVAGAPVDGDVTINSTARKTWGQYSVIRFIKLDTNLWNVVGGSV